MADVGKQLEINYNVAKLTEEEAKRIFDKVRAELNQVTEDYNEAKIPYQNVVALRCVKSSNVQYTDGTVWYLDKSDDYNRVLNNVCTVRSKWIEYGRNKEDTRWRQFVQSNFVGTQLGKDNDNYGEGRPLYVRNKQVYDTYKLLEIRYNDLRVRDDIARDNYGVARINTGKALADWTRWKESNMTPEELEELNKDIFEGSIIDMFSWKTIGIGFGVLVVLFGIYWYIKRR
jgi:hypothetical protein